MSCKQPSIYRRYLPAFLLLAVSFSLQSLTVYNNISSWWETAKAGAVVLMTACLFSINRPVAWIQLCGSAAATVLAALPSTVQRMVSGSLSSGESYRLTALILQAGCLFLCLLAVPLGKKLPRPWMAPLFVCALTFFARWLVCDLLYTRMFVTGGELQTLHPSVKPPSPWGELAGFAAACLLYGLFFLLRRLARGKGTRLYRRLSRAARPHLKECLTLFCVLFFLPFLLKTLALPYELSFIGYAIPVFGIAALFSRNSFYGWVQWAVLLFATLGTLIFNLINSSSFSIYETPWQIAVYLVASLLPTVALLLTPALFRLISSKAAGGILGIAGYFLVRFGSQALSIFVLTAHSGYTDIGTQVVFSVTLLYMSALVLAVVLYLLYQLLVSLLERRRAAADPPAHQNPFAP